jgi:hypothetical protein
MPTFHSQSKFVIGQNESTGNVCHWLVWSEVWKLWELLIFAQNKQINKYFKLLLVLFIKREQHKQIKNKNARY